MTKLSYTIERDGGFAFYEFHGDNAPKHAVWSVGRSGASPNGVAFRGRVQVGYRFGDWLDNVTLIDPTWGDLMHAVDRYVEATGDYDHSFLEGAHRFQRTPGAFGNVELILGS